MKKETRSIRITVRFTEEEIKKINKESKGHNKSDYIRNKVIHS